MMKRDAVRRMALGAVVAAFAFAAHADIDLNGTWCFRFEKGKGIAECAGAEFEATDRITVPACYDTLPKWFMQRGTGLYRRKFTLDKPVENAWLVVDGMGLAGKFTIDGKDLGTHPYPYAKLEIETGPLAAGEHTLFAALDNRFDWSVMKVARPYYDFYCYGGFYHGVKLSFDNRKLRVRTRNYADGTVEVEAVNFKEKDFDAVLKFDGGEVNAKFAGSRATVKVPAFKNWSPESPNLHTVELGGVKARFGIREIKAEKGKLYLNGKELYLKGANRHEAHPTFGAATPEALMVADIQNLKALGGNFFRGAHYQQSQRFLDLCDENGILVWEESIGWGNGQRYTMVKKIDEFKDELFVKQQIDQTREMVRASFNHPSVIIFAYMNEFASQRQEGKEISDKIIEAIRAEDSGRLVSFACNMWKDDLCHAETDLISFNTYPGWIGSDPGEPENLKKLIADDVAAIVAHFSKKYPGKPILVSEMGTCGVYGHHDAAGAQWTEEFEAEYLADVLDAVFSTPEICGISIWQFTDARSYHRGGATVRAKPFAENLAGLYDGYRRAKIAVKTVKEKFAEKK